MRKLRQESEVLSARTVDSPLELVGALLSAFPMPDRARAAVGLRTPTHRPPHCSPTLSGQQAAPSLLPRIVCPSGCGAGPFPQEPDLSAKAGSSLHLLAPMLWIRPEGNEDYDFFGMICRLLEVLRIRRWRGRGAGHPRRGAVVGPGPVRQGTHARGAQLDPGRCLMAGWASPRALRGEPVALPMEGDAGPRRQPQCPRRQGHSCPQA